MRNWLGNGLRGSALALALLAAAPAVQGQGLAGPYLAGNQADLRNDYTAAARYYDDALRAAPDNVPLLNAALTVNVAAGKMSRGLDMARRLQREQPDNQLMALALMAEALRDEDYQAVLRLATTEAYRFNELFALLVEGWAQVGAGEFGEGVATFEAMDQEGAMRAYGQLNLALAHALAGDFETAATILDGEGEEGPLHINRLAMLTHFVSLSQAERGDEALEMIENTLTGVSSDVDLLEMQRQLEAGETLPFTQLGSAADGAAAAYAALAGALAREDAPRLGLFYARLATHIRPDYDEVTTLIGDTLAQQEQYPLAIAAYEEIAPGSPWYAAAEIGRAESLARADRTDEAVEVLSGLAREMPDLSSVHIALGDTLREDERFERAAEAYTRAIDLLTEDEPSQWRLYYVRGICYERTDRWDAAEADFRKALELNPEQPNVLNYLGYSLVELRRNLDEAEDMIERAVAQRPEDGFITDSLGWVLYRLGRYEEAVAPMERAVELEPVDPIINDHLGDVLWMVGRKMEARFQWRRALSFDPEQEEADRIRRKLEVGLDIVLAEEEADDDAGQATADSE